MSTLKKSLSTTADACAFKKAFQVRPDLFAAGPICCRRSRLRIAVAETRWPTFSNSPRIHAAPAPVLPRHPEDQLPDLGLEPRPANAPTPHEGGPLSPHQLPMLAQHRFGLDQEAQRRPRYQLAEGSQDRPVPSLKLRPSQMPAEHTELMAENEQLSFRILDPDANVQ